MEQDVEQDVDVVVVEERPRTSTIFSYLCVLFFIYSTSNEETNQSHKCIPLPQTHPPKAFGFFLYGVSGRWVVGYWWGVWVCWLSSIFSLWVLGYGGLWGWDGDWGEGEMSTLPRTILMLFSRLFPTILSFGVVLVSVPLLSLLFVALWELNPQKWDSSSSSN